MESSPVTWQTLFWALVALAISSMSQPGGRIIDLPSRYRTYLRCSPMICGADCLSIAIELTSLVFYVDLHPREALSMLIHERQRDQQDEGSKVGLQVFEQITWFRYLFFALGTLPQAIKLLSVHGIPGTQAFAILFLLSWLVNEVLYIYTPNHHAARANPLLHISPRYLACRAYLQTANALLASLALGLHSVALNAALRALSPAGPGPYPHTYANTTTSLIMTLFLSTVLFLPPVASPAVRACIAYKTWALYALPFLLFGTASELPLYALYHAPANPVLHAVLKTAAMLFLLSASVVLAFYTAFRLAGARFPGLARVLLVDVPRAEAEGSVEIDYVACHAFCFLFFTILTTLFWYRFVADLSQTVAPAWSGVFARSAVDWGGGAKKI